MTNGAAALFMRTAYQNAAIYFGDTPLVQARSSAWSAVDPVVLPCLVGSSATLLHQSLKSPDLALLPVKGILHVRGTRWNQVMDLPPTKVCGLSDHRQTPRTDDPDLSGAIGRGLARSSSRSTVLP